MFRQQLSAINLSIYKSIVLLGPIHESLRSLCQHLKYVLLGLFHHLNNLTDEFIGDFVVEKVRHRVHENHLWFFPTHRHFETARPELQIKPLFVGMPDYAAKPLRERFSVT